MILDRILCADHAVNFAAGPLDEFTILFHYTCLKPLGVLLLDGGAVEELVGRLSVGEVETDAAHALVTPPPETQARDGLALQNILPCS